MLVWLVGSGIMAIAYAAVLKELPLQLTVIGRGSASAAAFTQSTGLPVVKGGVDQALASASSFRPRTISPSESRPFSKPPVRLSSQACDRF